MKVEFAVVICLLSILHEVFGSENHSNEQRNGTLEAHSRRKRYIVFPKGSSLQILLEVLSHVPSQFLLVLGPTVQIAWPLPSHPFEHPPEQPSEAPSKISTFRKRSTTWRKHEMLNDISRAFDFGGVNGKECVLRALCESGQRTPAKKGFLREILHKIFSYDEGNEEEVDSSDDKIYRKAHQSLNQNCEALYPECPFSIFKAIH